MVVPRFRREILSACNLSFRLHYLDTHRVFEEPFRVFLVTLEPHFNKLLSAGCNSAKAYLLVLPSCATREYSARRLTIERQRVKFLVLLLELSVESCHVGGEAAVVGELGQFGLVKIKGPGFIQAHGVNGVPQL